MTTLVLATTLSAAQASAPGGMAVPSGDTGAQRLVPRVTGAVHSGATNTQLPGRVTAKVAPESSGPTVGAGTFRKNHIGVVGFASVDVRGVRCKSARVGLAWYRGRQADWLKLRGAAPGPPRNVPSRIGRKPHSCADARYLASVARERASIARRGYERWLERRMLRDFSFAPGADAWPKAVREVQRVFGGTEGWLLSCSAAEGGHGRWVGYGGQGYSTWLRDSDTVGGPLQFRYSTFKGMFRRAVDHVYAHGYRVPIFTSYTDAWRSALGQALAGGWARYTGNDNSHWSASFGRGC